MSISQSTDKLWNINTVEYYRVMKRSNYYMQNKDEPHRCNIEQKKLDTKEYMLHDPFYTKVKIGKVIDDAKSRNSDYL